MITHASWAGDPFPGVIRESGTFCGRKGETYEWFKGQTNCLDCLKIRLKWLTDSNYGRKVGYEEYRAARIKSGDIPKMEEQIQRLGFHKDFKEVLE